MSIGVGSVTFDRHGREVTATLHPGGHWECPEDPSAVTFLDIVFEDLVRRYSPGDGVYGAAILIDVAKQLGGTSVYFPCNSKLPPDPDWKY